MNRLRAIVKKEIIHIRRDPLSLGLLILVPAFLLLLYGYALSFDVKHIKVAVLDEDQTQASRFLLDSLFQNPYFDRAGTLSSRAEIDNWLKRGKARIVLVIPNDFTGRIGRGQKASVQALIDGADATAANVAVGYLDVLAERITLQSGRRAPGGGTAFSFRGVIQNSAGGPLKLEPRVWFNPDLQSAHFLIPGLMGMLLMISSVIATSLSIVREKERETIEQINVSAVRPEELILGKILPYFLICLLTTLIVLGVGYFIFGVAIRGSLFLLGGSILIFLFAALGMGLLISAATNSQQEAFQLAIISTLLPSIILSGLIFPIASMPRLIQGISFLVLPRYFVSVMRSLILKDASFSMIWPQLAAMIVLGLVFNLLAARLMEKNRLRKN
jgi:ABC-2 type transport system permease protein